MISPFVSTPEITDVTPYVSPVGVLVIISSDDYTRVAEHLLTITAFRRQVQAFFKPLKDAAHAAHKGLCDREKETLAPADADEQRIKRALVEYTTAQDRIRHAEEARLMVEQRQAEEARRLDEAAALEREFKATGDVALQEQAEAILDAPMPVMSVQAPTPAAPKVEGISYRETYRAQVSDLMTLVKAVAAGQQPITLLVANQSALDGMARALKGALAIPGVQLVVDKTPVTRTR